MVIAAIMVVGGDPQKIDEDMTRHITLNTIRSYRSKYKEKYGEIVICCDNERYWRKEVFPYYKASRKINREKSKYDWHVIFSALHNIREELNLIFPYKVLNVPGAEADDIIGTLTPVYSNNEKILIISSDKDFLQLQKWKNVTQYSPNLNKFISTGKPLDFLKEHIIKGETSDGIPNFLSADDVLVLKQRQKPISSKKLESWLGLEPELFCDQQMLSRYKRNQKMIDLEYIPNEIKKSILDEYKKEKVPVGNREMTNYFMEHNLKNLFGVMGEFR